MGLGQSIDNASPSTIPSIVLALGISAGALVAPFALGTLQRQLTIDLNISSTLLGASIGLCFITSGVVASLYGGKLADAIGWRRAAMISSVIALISLVGVAYLSRDRNSLIAWLLLDGVAMGLSGPASSLTLAREVDKHQQGLSFGLKQTGLPLSTLLVGASLPTITVIIGWRHTLAAFAIIPATTFVAAARARASRATRPSSATAMHSEAPKALLGLPLLSIGAGLAMLAGSAAGTFYVASLIDAGITPSVAGTAFAVASALAILLRVGGGWAADRFRLSGLWQVLFLMTAGAVGYAFLAARDSLPFLVLGGLVGYGIGIGWNGLLMFGIVRRYPVHVGHAIGVNQLGMAVGAAAGPFAVAFLAERYGHGFAWISMGALAAIGCLCVFAYLILYGTHPKKANQWELEA